MLTVTTAAGSQSVNGTNWGIDAGGYLTIVDGSDNNIASYAPGVWQSVEMAAAESS